MSEKIKTKTEVTMEDLEKITGGSNIDWGDMSVLPYTCPVCKAVITTKEALLSHIVGEIAQSIQGLVDSSRETEINIVK